MTIKEKFQNVAIREYNKKNKTKYDTFAELQPSLANGTDVLCEDQYFGIIRIEKSIPSFCEWIIVPSALDKKNSSDEEKAKLKKIRLGKDLCIKYRLKSESLKTIVIVLESPHDKEFFKINNIYHNVGPACGTTGENLMKWFPETVMNYVPCVIDSENNFKAKYHSAKDIESGVYALKLVNAIQFQCSLGEKPTVYRNKVFNKLWKDSKVKDSFVERLKDAKPDVVINCCTNSGKKKVQKEIEQCKKSSTLLLFAAHPSSYHFKNGLSWVDESEEQI